MHAATTAQSVPAGTYTIVQLARLLNCSISHVRRLDAERAIPGRLILGRLVRFSRRQIDAWLDGEVGRSQPPAHR